jgi:hypothetical protein
LAPALVLDFCCVVVPPEASCEPDLVSVEDLPDALRLVEELSFEGCLALFCMSAPWRDFCCDDWPSPFGQAPDASGVQSVPVVLEPDCAFDPDGVPV